MTVGARAHYNISPSVARVLRIVILGAQASISHTRLVGERPIQVLSGCLLFLPKTCIMTVLRWLALEALLAQILDIIISSVVRLTCGLE